MFTNNEKKLLLYCKLFLPNNPKQNKKREVGMLLCGLWACRRVKIIK